MAERAVRREWGEPPLYVREGGTMPVASLIEKMLGAPALMIPMGQSSDNCHLANERLRRVNLIKGKNVVSLHSSGIGWFGILSCVCTVLMIAGAVLCGGPHTMIAGHAGWC
jgi:hypothetical protein